MSRITYFAISFYIKKWTLHIVDIESWWILCLRNRGSDPLGQSWPRPWQSRWRCWNPGFFPLELGVVCRSSMWYPPCETSSISMLAYIKPVWFHSLWFSTFPGNFPKFDAIGRRSWSKCRKCLSIPCGSAQCASRIGTLTTGVLNITTNLNPLLGILSENRKSTGSN